MNWRQSYPNVVGLNEGTITIERQCLMSTLQMALISIIWLSSWLHIPPKPPRWRRISAAWRLCVRSQCGEAGGVGGGLAAPRDLLGSPRSSETKGTLWHRLTHPRKHYFLSHQLQHPPHMSCSLPRTESPFLTSSAVKHSQQQSVLTICSYWHSTTVNYICGGTGIHKVWSLTNNNFNRQEGFYIYKMQ